MSVAFTKGCKSTRNPKLSIDIDITYNFIKYCTLSLFVAYNSLLILFNKCIFPHYDLLRCSSGKSGPFMNFSRWKVSAWFTLCHCVIRASWCRQLMHMLRNVFHRDGDGKHLWHARSHIVNRTLSTRSHRRSPISSAITWLRNHCINHKSLIKLFCFELRNNGRI